MTPNVPASFLQEHPNARLYLDQASSAGMFLLLLTNVFTKAPCIICGWFTDLPACSL